MRTYLTIISFVLFIYAVSSRSILSSSYEDNSNQVDQEANRRNLEKVLLISRLRNFLENDEEKTADERVQVGNESDDEDNSNNDDDDDDSKEDTRKKRQTGTVDDSNGINDDDSNVDDDTNEVDSSFQDERAVDNFNNGNNEDSSDTSSESKSSENTD